MALGPLKSKRTLLKPLKTSLKMSGQSLRILGVGVDSTSTDSVLKFIAKKMAKKERFWITTPNPEFIVEAQKDREFKRILNHADMAVPDGFGLVLASRFFKTDLQIKERVSGSDLVEKLLEMATQNGWRIGVIGARRGNKEEIKELISRLEKKFRGLEIDGLENISDWQKKNYDIIFTAQGMKTQEKWIWKNFGKVKAIGFMGIGGSLDFLAGFAKRAPLKIRELGLEWLWRLIHEPWRIKRQISLLEFGFLVLKEKFRRSK